MKGLFPQYAVWSNRKYEDIWKEALFVFDANVLLNLYRYQASTRDELLKVLEHLSGRIWVPYHVALEFQRNRLKVVAEQNRRFSEVRRTIEKAKEGLVADLDRLQLPKRHSLINPQSLVTGFESLVAAFLTELDTLQETQQKLTATDLLKDRIEALFEGRVGIPPKDQVAVDELQKQAETRFKLMIPPGYQDADKGKDEPDGYIHGGILYKRKYGDYIVWQQLLAHAKASNSKAVIFVTDDGKDDWWLRIDSDGRKTIGARPELIEEARLSASVESFLMYKPEGFLKYAKEFLKAQVSEETLSDVREVSTNRWGRRLIDGQQDLAAQRRALNFVEQAFFAKVISYAKAATPPAGSTPNEAVLEDVPFGQPTPSLHLEATAVGGDTAAIVAAQTKAGMTLVFQGTCSVGGKDQLVIGFRQSAKSDASA
jgi:hypothetical protein